MDDEVVIIDEETQIDVIDDNINIIEVQEEVDSSTSIETVETIQVLEEPPLAVEFDDSVAPLDEIRDETLHGSLEGRYLANQHTIESITGLQETINSIQELKTTINTKNFNCANYYKWQDGNTSVENRDGLFVAFVAETNKIKICTRDDEIFGVTAQAGFVGGQDDTARDHQYAPVVCSGLVNVKCELSVNAEDYVVCNNFGKAEKSDNGYGYKVVAVSDIQGVRYASISLVPFAKQIVDMADNVIDLGQRVTNAENNIVTAVNVSNQAINQVQNAINAVAESVASNTESINNTVIGIRSDMDDIEDDIEIISADAAQALAIANTAASTAETIRREAVSEANAAVANVSGLTNVLKPILEWESDGIHGADYCVTNFVQDHLNTKLNIQTAESNIENVLSMTKNNAAGLQTLVSSIDKYSVGEYSQAYGLTIDEAKDILKAGMVYIPFTTENSYTHTEIYDGSPGISMEFTKSYHYIWNGEQWVESATPSVFFSSEYVDPIGDYIYWYVNSNENVNHNDSIYQSKTLYIWQDDQWVAVNTLSDNVTNRIQSMINQTADSLSAEISNARGSIAALELKIDNGTSQAALESALTTEVKFAVISDSNIVDSANKLPSSVAIGTYGAVYKDKKDSSIIIKSIISDSSTIPSGAKVGDYYAVGVSSPYSVFKFDGGDALIEVPNTEYRSNGNVYKTKVSYEVYKYDGTRWNLIPNYIYDGKTLKQIKTASIVESVNNSGSDISINADKINFTGFSTFVRQGDLGIGGATTIDGSRLTTGVIKSANYVPDVSGTRLSLLDGSFDTKYFKITSGGSITATDGTIGGWTIKDNIICSGVSTNYVGLSSSNDYQHTYAIWTGDENPESAPFSVTRMGAIKATYGTIGNWTLSSGGLYKRNEYGGLEMYFGTEDIDEKSIAGSESKTDWRLTIWNNFGVDDAGYLYAQNAKIQGTISCDQLFIKNNDIYEQIEYLTSDSIKANNLSVDGLLTINDYYGNLVGYLGCATGFDGKNTTAGVALSYSRTLNRNYIICTGSGVRMQCGSNSLYITDQGCYVSDGYHHGLIGEAVFGA